MGFIKRFLISIALVTSLLMPAVSFAGTGGIDPTNNTSRLCSNADCSTYTLVYWTTTNGPAVSVSDTGLTGYAWSSELGWINFAPTNGGVTNTTSGVLGGYAWGSTAGWVNFAPTHGGVTINTSTGEFSGYAWVSGGGWMKFDCSLSDACVKTTWRPTSGTTTSTSGSVGGNGGGGPGGGVTTGTSSTSGTTTTSGTTSGTSAGTSGTSGTTGGTTATTGTTTSGTSSTSGTTSGTTTSGTTTSGTTSSTSGTSTSGTSTSGTSTSGTSGTSGSGTGGSGGGTGGGIGGGNGGGTGIIGSSTTGGTTGGGGCPTDDATDLLGHVKNQVTDTFCNTKTTVGTTVQKIKDIINGKKGGTVSVIIATGGLITGASLTIASSLFLNPLSFSEIFLIPARLWSLLMAAFGLKKRRRPWGTVYDSITKQPLDPAYVTLRTMDGVEVTSSITDLDGRFGFVVPEPGHYTIFAQKTNYLFPSQKLVGYDHDELYRDLYFGEHFYVAKAGDVVIKNIPMDPEKFDWNEFAKKQQNLMKFYSKRDKILRRLSNTLFVFGFVVASIAVLAAPKTYNIVIFLLYVVLFFIRQHGTHSRPYGDIMDAHTEMPISFAIIRISSASTGVEVMHRIADMKGRYYALLPNGDYKVRIDRKLPDGKYQTIAKDLTGSVSKGYLSKTFLIDVSNMPMISIPPIPPTTPPTPPSVPPTPPTPPVPPTPPATPNAPLAASVPSAPAPTPIPTPIPTPAPTTVQGGVVLKPIFTSQAAPSTSPTTSVFVPMPSQTPAAPKPIAPIVATAPSVSVAPAAPAVVPPPAPTPIPVPPVRNNPIPIPMPTSAPVENPIRLKVITSAPNEPQMVEPIVIPNPSLLQSTPPAAPIATPIPTPPQNPVLPEE